MITESDLQQFTGTEQYHKHWTGLLYTDGIAHIAENAEAYWLIDLVASHQPALKGEEFQVWVLKKTEEWYTVVANDGNDNVIKRQNLEFTDFPEDLMPFKMYLVSGILLLPSEY